MAPSSTGTSPAISKPLRRPSPVMPAQHKKPFHRSHEELALVAKHRDANRLGARCKRQQVRVRNEVMRSASGHQRTGTTFRPAGGYRQRSFQHTTRHTDGRYIRAVLLGIRPGDRLFGRPMTVDGHDIMAQPASQPTNQPTSYPRIVVEFRISTLRFNTRRSPHEVGQGFLTPCHRHLRDRLPNRGWIPHR